MFYVYEWYIVDTGEIIYVGKGTRLRCKVRKHNKFFNDMIRRCNCDSRIIKTFDSEEDAFKYEYERVKELKSIGQCVCNIRDGGFGGDTSWWTDELRDAYSKNNVMKSEKQRKRMSEKNPMKIKSIAMKTNAQKRRAVIIGEKKYDSVKDAMDAEHVSYEVIANWCHKGINQRGELCRFKDSKQVVFTDKRYNKGGSRAVVFRGERYECIKDFAKEIGISERTASEWLHRGFNTLGEPCRYENDTREGLVFENRHIKRNKNRAKPIILDGVRYNNVLEASKKTGLKKTTIYSYLQGRRKCKHHTCIYDNQQPSQGNTDNSTLEGSTTNG